LAQPIGKIASLPTLFFCGIQVIELMMTKRSTQPKAVVYFFWAQLK